MDGAVPGGMAGGGMGRRVRRPPATAAPGSDRVGRPATGRAGLLRRPGVHPEHRPLGSGRHGV